MENNLKHGDKVLGDIKYNDTDGGFFIPNCKVYSQDITSEIMEIILEDKLSGKSFNIRFKKIK